MNMENFARKQTMINNLKLNLSELKKERLKYITELLKIDRQIEKHESFLEELENGD